MEMESEAGEAGNRVSGTWDGKFRRARVRMFGQVSVPTHLIATLID